jgi:hypothetical protein
LDVIWPAPAADVAQRGCEFGCAIEYATCDYTPLIRFEGSREHTAPKEIADLYDPHAANGRGISGMCQQRTPATGNQMACKTCEQIVDVTEAGGLYVIRNCSQCGRPIKLREPGKHGIGVQIRKGDQPVMPAGWLKIAANPLKGSGHLTKWGLGWFAGLLFGNGLETRQHDFSAAIAELDDEYGEVLKKSPLLAALDIEDPEQSEAVFNKVSADKSTPEWWLYVSGTFLSIAKDAIEKQDAPLAAWAVACAERFRSLYLFKAHFEEVVWMGHSVKRLTDLLGLWEANKTNGDEEFWQIQFQSHSFAFTQLFSVPITLIEGKAYVGGQGIDRSDARFVDFLFSGGSASEAILIEIKTPVTPLIQKQPYRGNVYAPSSKLAGSVVQVADYRGSLNRELDSLNRGKKYDLAAFKPKAVVIIGNSTELNNDKKIRSFQLFRSSLSDVEIVTFDELFLKIERLASLFNLVRKST